MPKDTQDEGQTVENNNLFEMGMVKEDLLKMYEKENDDKVTHIDTNQYL